MKPLSYVVQAASMSVLSSRVYCKRKHNISRRCKVDSLRYVRPCGLLSGGRWSCSKLMVVAAVTKAAAAEAPPSVWWNSSMLPRAPTTQPILQYWIPSILFVYVFGGELQWVRTAACLDRIVAAERARACLPSCCLVLVYPWAWKPVGVAAAAVVVVKRVRGEPGGCS